MSTPDGIALTAKQQEAIKMGLEASENAKKGNPGLYKLTGYAGTGKTTVLKNIIHALGGILKCKIIAPTGKAAIRAIELTGIGKTLHSWALRMTEVEHFDSTDEATKRLIKVEPVFAIKDVSDKDFPDSSLVIIDEASMVSYSAWCALWYIHKNHSVSLLFVGDDFQLLPIADKMDTAKVIDRYGAGVIPPLLDSCSNVKNFRPLVDIPFVKEVALTEVHRQALDSPLLRAASAVRDPVSFDLETELGGIEKIKLEELCPKYGPRIKKTEVKVIVWKNESRVKLNHYIRNGIGISGPLQQGEPLIVRKNNYRINMVNGVTFTFPGFGRTVAFTQDPSISKINLPQGLAFKELKDPFGPRYFRRSMGTIGDEGYEEGDFIDDMTAEEIMLKWVYKNERLRNVSGKVPVEKVGPVIVEEMLMESLGDANPGLFERALSRIQKAREYWAKKNAPFYWNRSNFLRQIKEKGLKSVIPDGYIFLHTQLGYVSTCHSAQGSEWEEVIILPEIRPIRSDPNPHLSARQWFYTALTRARLKASLIIEG